MRGFDVPLYGPLYYDSESGNWLSTRPVSERKDERSEDRMIRALKWGTLGGMES